MEKYATTVPYCTYNDNCGDVFFKWGILIPVWTIVIVLSKAPEKLPYQFIRKIDSIWIENW